MNSKCIKNVTRESIAPYGVLLEPTGMSKTGFEIIVREENTGWRLAVLEIERKSSKTIENHPTSMESFEPVYGVTLIILAPNGTPENFEVFLLDKPICLDKGIWHQVITLSEKSMVKITENLNVTSEYYNFENDLVPALMF
jgi:ureidoglycolate hydrolase